MEEAGKPICQNAVGGMDCIVSSCEFKDHGFIQHVWLRQFHAGHRSSQHLAALRDIWRWEKSLPRHGTLWRWRFGKVRPLSFGGDWMTEQWQNFSDKIIAESAIAFILQFITISKKNISEEQIKNISPPKMHLDTFWRWSGLVSSSIKILYDFVGDWEFGRKKITKVTNRRTGWVFCLGHSEVWSGWTPRKLGGLVHLLDG